MLSKDKLTCPSYVAIPHARVIGKIDTDGNTSFFEENIALTSDDIKSYKNEDIPFENTIRLAGLCAKGACSQWSTDKQNCSLGERVVSQEIFGHYEDFKNCSIKDTCRWRAEQGEKVCPRCTTVVRYVERLS